MYNIFTFALYVFAVYYVLEARRLARSRFMSTVDSVEITKATALSHGTPCVCVLHTRPFICVPVVRDQDLDQYTTAIC